MKKWKSLNYLFLVGVVLAVLMILPVSADPPRSGWCGKEGDNLSWTLDSSGTLTVSGSGEMKDFTYDAVERRVVDLPWANLYDEIFAVVIEDGVTTIGDFAFNKLFYIEQIDLGDDIRSIGYAALNGTHIQKVVLPDSLEKLGYSCFGDCSSLMYVEFPDHPVEVGEYAFYECHSLERILNCPDKEWQERMEHSRFLLDQWINPGAFTGGQSPVIQELAQELTGSCGSPYQKAGLISLWISQNIVYDNYRDEGRAYSSVALEPEEVLECGKTVCEGYARLTQALFRAAGIPCLHIIGQNISNPDVWHAWNLAWTELGWIWLDNTGGMRMFDIGTAFLAQTYDLNWGVKLSHDCTVYPQDLTAASDIPSKKAQKDIRKAFRFGLVPDGLQGAYGSEITREEFCRMIVKLLEKCADGSLSKAMADRGMRNEIPFKDTTDPAVQTAYSLGLIHGRGSGTFDPDRAITGREAATVLKRTADYLGISVGDPLPLTSASYTREQAILDVCRFYCLYSDGRLLF